MGMGKKSWEWEGMRITVSAHLCSRNTPLSWQSSMLERRRMYCPVGVQGAGWISCERSAGSVGGSSGVIPPYHVSSTSPSRAYPGCSFGVEAAQGSGLSTAALYNT